MPMETQSRVSIKGTSGPLTANVFSIHDPAGKYILGKSLVKKVKSAFVQASHTTRAYPVPALPNNPCFIYVSVSVCNCSSLLGVIAVQPGIISHQ